jgi:hypothetical protein
MSEENRVVTSEEDPDDKMEEDDCDVRIKYAKRLGVSTHQAAALAIGRRGLGFREHAPTCSVIQATVANPRRAP